MKKDAYYFPHFSNARNDAKLIKVRRVLGVEGYGIYFMLLEILREQTEFKFPLAGIEDLAYEWHTSKEKILSIVNDFELFEIINSEFFSPKLLLYLHPYLEKSKRASLAAKKRWNQIKGDANALQKQSKSNASKVKESKVKESKVKNNIENCKENLIQRISWIEKIGMEFKLKTFDITKYLNEFFTEQELKGNANKNEMEYQSHFISWLKIKESSNDNNKKTVTSEDILKLYNR